MTSAPFTVGTLRAALEQFPDDLPVILAEDEEGNDFNELYDVEVSKYIASDVSPVHPDDVDSYDPEDLTDAVVLWP